MVGLYKDPKGDGIFQTVSNSMGVESTLSNLESTLGNSEVPGLRKRIRELESEVKEIKDVGWIRHLKIDLLFYIFCASVASRISDCVLKDNIIENTQCMHPPC